MDVLRDDLDLNATIATSVDLYTWSISRYPETRSPAGLWLFEDGRRDPFAVCRDFRWQRPPVGGTDKGNLQVRIARE